MKIGFISDFAFPIGMASTNRIISLALGLIKEGHEVYVYITKPTELKNNVINNNLKGNYKGINYIYTTNTSIRPNNRIKLFVIYIIGFVNLFIKANRSNKSKKFDMVISSAPKNFLLNYFYIIFFKLKKIKTILAIDEYPYIIRHQEIYPKIYIKYILYNYYKRYDYLIIMTKNLISYFKPLIIGSKTEIIHVPMTVELERFQKIVTKPPIDGKYICYCGSFINNKDGIPILINAFKVINKEFPDVKLVIIGGGNIGEDKDFNEFKKITENNNLENKVIFTGKVKREDIPSYLCNATILALARPDNMQAKGGFPTKLGEYLATGKPVVITRVGEISDYLTDEYSAYIANPDDAMDFARKMRVALLFPDKSKQVGINGLNIAINNFSNNNVTKKLIEHLCNNDFVK